MTSRQEAVEELRLLGIGGQNIYLLDVIALIAMIWADGKVQESELVILDEYLRTRIKQINEMVSYEMLDVEDARAFAYEFIRKRPSPEFLEKLTSFVGPIILTSSDPRYVNAMLKSLLEACIDIAANAVCDYPYDMHGRFDSREKACFFSILRTLIEFRGHDEAWSGE